MRDWTARVLLGTPPLLTQQALGDRDSAQLIALFHIMTRHPTQGVHSQRAFAKLKDMGR